jgi:hypothetical protein
MSAESIDLTKGRIFDRAAFSREIHEDLDHISDQVYKLRRIYKIKNRTHKIANLRIRLKETQKYHFYLEGDKITNGLSSHQKLSIKGHTASIIKTAQHIAERIAQEAPILAEPDMSLDMVVALRTRQGPKSRLAIKRMTFDDPFGFTLNSELSEKVALAIERIAGTPAGPRVFQFSTGNRIHARTPEEAYRIYAAIAFPKIFGRKVINPVSCPQIHEVLDPEKYITALQEG